MSDEQLDKGARRRTFMTDVLSDKRFRPAFVRTAYHEAGHAVIAHLVNQPFVYVTVIPSGDSAGHVQYDDAAHQIDVESLDPFDSVSRVWVDNAIMVDFAGMLSEQFAPVKRKGRKKETKKAFSGASYDLASTVEERSGVCLSESEREHYIFWLYERTRNLLRIRWVCSSIRVVADELLVHGKLDYEEVAALIAGVREDASPLTANGT